MSFIWEQLKDSKVTVRHAPRERFLGDGEGFRLHAVRTTERRKSGRTDTYVPLFVYGHALGREPFHEDTNSVEVSENGGLLRLDAPVSQGQKLLLQNKVSQQELECTVVRVEKQLKRTYVGVVLDRSDASFWRCIKHPS